MINRAYLELMIHERKSDLGRRARRHARSFRELLVYQKANELTAEIFRLSAAFPHEETYSLTDQIRRSSRSMGAHIAEAWGKRRYRRAFIFKLAETGAEELGTEHWIHVAETCGYLTREKARHLIDQLTELGRMLNSMTRKADRFCGPSPE